MYQHDRLTDYFEEIKGYLEFDYCFFGHYHDNMAIQNKYILLYEQIIQVEPLE